MRITSGDITPMFPLPLWFPVMNSLRSWLALTAALGLLALIALQLPPSHPAPAAPPLQTFNAVSTSITCQLEDDPPQLAEGQMVGELRAPVSANTKPKSDQANPPAGRKSDRDQTRVDPPPERPLLAGSAMMG